MHLHKGEPTANGHRLFTVIFVNKLIIGYFIAQDYTTACGAGYAVFVWFRPFANGGVDEYQMPDVLFDKILYVEKKGLWPILEKSKLAAKYDIAIACAEGYATKAAKTLLARAESHVTVLCLHDADPCGYEIYRTLADATRRCDFGVDVIDIGLHLCEALDMGLQTEKFTRKNALPSGLNLNDTEREYFQGQWQYGSWLCERIELNDLASDPSRFIKWLEGKLEEHGLNAKLIPADEKITTYGEEQRDEKLKDWVRDHIHDLIDIDGLVDTTAENFAEKIRVDDLPKHTPKWGAKLDPSPWRQYVERLVDGRIKKIHEALENATEAAVDEMDAERKKEGQGDDPPPEWA